MSDAPASPAGVSTSPATVIADSAPTEGAEGAPEAAEDPSALFRKHKHRMKVDGKDVELDYDALVREAQKGRSADERFQRASTIAKQVEAQIAELEGFRKNPWESLKKAGQDPYAMAEKLLLEKLEWEDLDPSERRAREKEFENEQLKKQLSAKEEAEKAAAAAEAEAAALAEIDTEISEAVQALGRKPTPRLLARITETMIADFESQGRELRKRYGERVPDEAWKNAPRLKASDAVSKVHREYLSDIAEYLGGMPVAEMRKLLPKEILDGLRKADVDEVLSQDPVGSRRTRQQSAPRPQSKKTARQSTDDWLKNIEKRLG